VKASCLCKISLPVYVQTGSSYKAPAASHLSAAMCTGHSVSALVYGTVSAMPLAQSLVDEYVSCITRACIMLILRPDTIGMCCFSHVRKQSFVLLDHGVPSSTSKAPITSHQLQSQTYCKTRRLQLRGLALAFRHMSF